MAILRRLPRVSAWLAEPVAFGRMLPGLSRADVVLLAACIAVYLATRLVRIADYPVYFFCDEAANGNLAENLLRHRFTAWDGVFPDGTLLPSYFSNAGRIYPSITVYIHALSILLFGKSLLVVRATSAMVSALAAVAVALALKSAFKVRSWWVAPLLLTVTPIWFLHSRTAFESVTMVSFYACFLTAYLLYRSVTPAWAPVAVLAGAGTFYAHPNGQGIMLVTGVLLLGLDARHHLRTVRGHRRVALASVVLLALATVPYARLLIAHPHTTREELTRLDSYLFHDAPLRDKLAEFSRNYTTALSPTYWFAPHYESFEESPERPSWVPRLHFTPPPLPVFEALRHTMRGYGSLPLVAAPFVLVGLLITLRKVRSSAIHRAILVAAVAAPFTSALVELHQQRVMALIVPATLLACIGLEPLIAGLSRLLPRALVAGATALLLLVLGYRLTADALQNGPLWTTDYGLYGVQWGASQLFAAVNDKLVQTPERRFLVSDSWANNTEEFIPFFVPAEQQGRVLPLDLDELLFEEAQLDPDTHYVLAPEDLDRVVETYAFVVEPERILRYPDGRPGFYFVRLSYAEGVDQFFTAQRLSRFLPVESSVTIGGEDARVSHSPLDMGRISDAFDGNLGTLVRGAAANPLVVDVVFQQPRIVRRITLDAWLSRFTVSSTVFQTGDAEPLRFTHRYARGEGRAHVELDVPGVTRAATRVRIELCDDGLPAPTHILLSEVGFR